MTEKTVENMSFEECMNELNDLVNRLESGELDLDESLKVYERAVKIRERCRAILDDAERKVQTIMASAGGEKREDFTEE
jgi:exodeoxyribonuclease VII small subunit